MKLTDKVYKKKKKQKNKKGNSNNCIYFAAELRKVSIYKSQIKILGTSSTVIYSDS